MFSHSSWFIPIIFLGGLSGLAVTLFPLRLVSRVSKLIQRNRCATCDSLGTELGAVEELRHPGKSRRSFWRTYQNILKRFQIFLHFPGKPQSPGEVLEKKKQLAVSSVAVETNKCYHLALLSGTNRT